MINHHMEWIFKEQKKKKTMTMKKKMYGKKIKQHAMKHDPSFTYSKSTIEKLEKGVKYV